MMWEAAWMKGCGSFCLGVFFYMGMPGRMSEV